MDRAIAGATTGTWETPGLRLPRPIARWAHELLVSMHALATSMAVARRGGDARPARASDRAERAAAALDAHGDSVLRYAYSYVHNMPDAEDVLQETLVRYLTKAPVFEDAGHESAWLLTVAGNLAKTRLRKANAHRTDQLSDELAAEGAADLSFVWDAVKELPENQRAAIHLFYEEGYPTAQIARIVGRGESTVRSDLTRARAKLKAILGERYDFDEQL